MREFMGFEASVAQTYPDIAFAQMGLMMDAITDQGEGSTLVQRLQAARAANLQAVQAAVPGRRPALEVGLSELQRRRRAGAVGRRGGARRNDMRDHYECFQEILATTSTRW